MTRPVTVVVFHPEATANDGPTLVEVVASMAGKTAYRVEPDGQGGAIETALAARILA